MAAGQVVLLGDSIFDNARYVPEGKCVIEHLREQLPAGWQATLLAVDGAVAEDVALQLRRLPEEATDLVVSVGGNDALGVATRLMEPAGSGAAYLERLAAVHGWFTEQYRDMLRGVVATRRQVRVCTIYDAIPSLSAGERAGLCVFNDVIVREALRARVAVLDLRQVCDDRDDYSAMLPIEPSVIGGKKIASAIERVVVESGDGRGVMLFGK